MSVIKKTVTRKAAKAAAKHTARGATSKVRRKPLRAVTLLGLGGAVGALAGWTAARTAAGPASAGSSS